MPRIHARLPLIIVLLALTSHGGVAHGEATHFSLDNGLRVSLLPTTVGKNAALIVLYDIGERHDPAGRSGLAHLVEHVYVTAAAGDRPAATAFEWFARYESQANAQTGLDYTVVAGVFPSARLGEEIDDAGRRMSDLRIEASDLEREKPRLYAELDNMYGGWPQLAAHNHVRQMIDPPPVGGRRGGVNEQVGTITVAQVRDWHARYYKPRNARVVVAGRFDPEEARRLITDAFAAIPAGDALPERRPREAVVTKTTRRITLEPAPNMPQQPHGVVMLGFAAPAPDSEHYVPFSAHVATMIFRTMMVQRANNPSQRLITYMPLDDPSAVYVSQSITPDDDPDRVLDQLRQFVRDVTLVDHDVPLDPNPLKQVYGSMLAFFEPADMHIAMNPYLHGFSLGRRLQLGLDGDRLRADADLTHDEMLICALEHFDTNTAPAVIITTP